MTLPDGWSETTVSNPDAPPSRVYRKSVGSRILTLDANTIDQNGGTVRLPTEWLLFTTLRDQLERK